MKFTKEERLDIGKKIYSGEITRYDAANIYGIGTGTARSYMRLYRDTNHLPPKVSSNIKNSHNQISCSVASIKDEDMSPDYERFQSMSKDELIKELVMSNIREKRLKKGYQKKGDGSIVLYEKKNMK